MQADCADYAECAEYAEYLTADGAYLCPVGSIWLFFLSLLLLDLEQILRPCMRSDGYQGFNCSGSSKVDEGWMDGVNVSNRSNCLWLFGWCNHNSGEATTSRVKGGERRSTSGQKNGLVRKTKKEGGSVPSAMGRLRNWKNPATTNVTIIRRI